MGHNKKKKFILCAGIFASIITSYVCCSRERVLAENDTEQNASIEESSLEDDMEENSEDETYDYIITESVTIDDVGTYYPTESKSSSRRSRARSTTVATEKYYDQLGEQAQELYEVLYDAYKDGPNTDEIEYNVSLTWEAQTVSVVDGEYDFSETEMPNDLSNIIFPAFFALVYDYPELNWIQDSGCSYNYSIGLSIKSGTETTGYIADLSVKTVWVQAAESSVDTTKEEMDSAISKAVDEINSTLDSNPDRYEIVKAIHDYVCNNVKYASDTEPDAYQTPYSAFYDVDGNGVIETVCAGYAKSFKILCQQYDIPSVLVSGIGKGSTTGYHMWNYVKMEDDNWYALDATWDDQTDNSSKKIMYDFFLVGGDTVDTHFQKKAFTDSHVSSGKWSSTTDYTFVYPVLSSDEYVYHTDKDNDGICDLCSSYMDGIGVHLAGHSLSLDGMIGVKFYMELSEDVISDQTAYMKFTLADGDIEKQLVSEADVEAISEKEYYVFTCDISAKEMTDTIKAQVFAENDEKTGTEYTYTVSEYASYILDNSDSYQQELSLVKAMLRYGTAAQNYFTYNTDKLADNILDEDDKIIDSISVDTLADYAKQETGTLPDGIDYYGSSLMLQADTTIKHYFTLEDGTKASDYTFTVNDVEVSPVDCGTYCYITVPDITADKLNMVYTIGVNGTYNISYGAFSYAYAILNGQYGNLVGQVAQALIAYGNAATTYMNK